MAKLKGTQMDHPIQETGSYQTFVRTALFRAQRHPVMGVVGLGQACEKASAEDGAYPGLSWIGPVNNILRLNLRKKLALHCNNVYFCPQFEVDTYGNLLMTSVSDWCPHNGEAAGSGAGLFLGDFRGAANFVVLQNESR